MLSLTKKFQKEENTGKKQAKMMMAMIRSIPNKSQKIRRKPKEGLFFKWKKLEQWTKD